MNIHDHFDPYYINMGSNGVEPVGTVTDAEGNRVCIAPTNEIADMIVAALNRDCGMPDAIEAERRLVWMNFNTPTAQKAAEEMLDRLLAATSTEKQGNKQ